MKVRIEVMKWLVMPFLTFALCFQTAAQWNQLGSVITGQNLADRLGWDVDISGNGNRIVVGSPYNDFNGTSSGLVRVYDWDGLSWNQTGNTIYGDSAIFNLGYRVVISSDASRIAAGAWGSRNKGPRTGSTNIYELNNGNWSLVGNEIHGENSGDRSSWSIDLNADGSRIIIGAIDNDGNGARAGHVRVFDDSLGVWKQVGNDIDGEDAGDLSGRSVSISADGAWIAIGASSNDGNGSDSGHTRIFEWDSGAWEQHGSDIDGEDTNDQSGYSVSLSGDGERVCIGARYNDDSGNSAGHVRVYEKDFFGWFQLGSDIDGEAAFDNFGFTTDMNYYGNRVVVGGPWNGGNGRESGHIRVFEYDGAKWNQIGKDMNGSKSLELFGYSVAISDHGHRVISGAIGNSASSNGKAVVFTDWALGAEDLARESDIMIFPNPSNGEVVVYTTINTSWNESLSITNILGEEVFRHPLKCSPGNNTIHLNLASLSKGIYFVGFGGLTPDREKLIINR